ncbi:MAG: 50S ribosomal protein L14e [Nanoarchaeota archaeon]|nr:50S ribosomal protein L14e [Nanoarchaeota archaeon]MCA9496736.1 50S ribosomal protein L14e [Nanoarchaeota archaeon]
MLTVGRICIKTAGRDAMAHCVVIEEIDETYVLIDGNTRRKKVNKAHLEPLNKTLNIKKGASTKDVFAAFEKEGIKVTKAAEAKPKKEQKAQVKKVKKGADKKKASKETKKEVKKETKTKKTSKKKE